MITTMLNEECVVIGRFKVRRLMGELGLICKQPGPHAYKQATVKRPDIPNRLGFCSTLTRAVSTQADYFVRDSGATAWSKA